MNEQECRENPVIALMRIGVEGYTEMVRLWLGSLVSSRSFRPRDPSRGVAAMTATTSIAAPTASPFRRS